MKRHEALIACCLLAEFSGVHRALSRLTKPIAVLSSAFSLLELVTHKENVHSALSSLLELTAHGAELSRDKPRLHQAKTIGVELEEPRLSRAGLAS